VLPSAQRETAGETNRSRWDHARVRLLIPIGVMVVVAIIGIAVGVLSSAQRANRISTDNEEQAILRSLDENAERALRHLESVASMPQATMKIRDSYDAEWIDRRVGEWLETFYNADIVAVFGIGGETEYFRSRVAGEKATVDLAAELAPANDILRGRIDRQPRRTVLVSPRDLAKPTKSVALFQNFLGRSAIVAAVAVGEQPDPANGNARAPVVALVYIDLDHFKDVNDTLGHHIGDELILNVTRRLSEIIRDDDLVARLGGDEFAIIMSCASDSYSLQAVAERILAAICTPFVVSGHGINIGASIGIAVIDSCTQDAGDILRYADMALYRAKNEGRNRACIYDAAMDADLSNRKLLESALRQAIKNRELHVVYQPIVDRSGKRPVGVEALARWVHPVQGEIPPARFIPIAEHSGLIVELGEFILRRACLDGRNWPGLTVSVNVSPLQFRRPDFVEAIERILGETVFEPNRLELELTESTLLGNLESAELSMLRLKGVGVCFALDDFGTGYSSLLYLRRFPFDKLKIDSSFVRSIEKAADAAAIVHAVVSLGRGLGMKVTAEGVETADQHLFLRAAGVHSMQGYPLRPAGNRGRDRPSHRRARGLLGRKSRSGNRGRELTFLSFRGVMKWRARNP